MARILIIDDCEHVRGLCRLILETEGHRVREAPNGAVRLRLLGEGPSEVVVCDLYMPEKDGIETILRLTREHPAVRVIAVSGASLRGLLDMTGVAARVGAFQTLSKPFGPAGLVAAVDRALGQTA